MGTTGQKHASRDDGLVTGKGRQSWYQVEDIIPVKERMSKASCSYPQCAGEIAKEQAEEILPNCATPEVDANFGTAATSQVVGKLGLSLPTRLYSERISSRWTKEKIVTALHHPYRKNLHF